MIDIITGHEAFKQTLAREEMHRLRYRVFKKRMGWMVDGQNGLEIDSYDTEKTIYFLAYNEQEKLCGTWRIMPTTGPYMLKDTFPQLLEGRAPPQNPRIWESSRFAVDGTAGQSEATQAPLNISRITQELFVGLVEFCIQSGIEQVYTVYDVRISRLLPHIGCEPFWQSKREKIGTTVALAGGFNTDIHVLKRMRGIAGISDTVIRSAPWRPIDLAA